MNKIRYTSRICTNKRRIEQFLDTSRVGIIAMNGPDFPYAVPVNYVYLEGTIYFHGMGSGKKVDLLGEKAPVCFSVFEEGGTVKDPIPCHVDTSYISVVINGFAYKTTDFEEAAFVLQAILDKYTPGEFEASMNATLVEKYRSSLDGNAVAVYRIEVESLTAKENPF